MKVLWRGHVKISKYPSHSAGLFDFFITLNYSVTIEQSDKKVNQASTMTMTLQKTYKISH